MEVAMLHHQSCCDHSEARFAGRTRRRSFRGFSRAFGPLGAGGGGFPFGRFVGDGELRLIVLALLAEGPRHGYDLIKAMEERSSGFYSPSPGVIYPTLTFLEEAGHASSAAEGNKKVFAITDSGRTYLAENKEAAEAILARISWVGKRLAQARNWFERGEGETAGARDRDIPDVSPELNEARRALKNALLSKLGASAEEQRRIADLLRRAAEEILGAPSGGPDTIDI
jgi:DNA-binding PadR family transcriptional regulator